MKIVVFKWDIISGIPASGNIHITNTIYDSTYVNNHYESISKVMLNFEYVCITDNPIGLRKEITKISLWDKCRQLGGCYNRLFIYSEEVKQ